MGIVFGKETVKEPTFDILLERKEDVKTPYQLRKYGERYAASIEYTDSGSSDDTSSPFRSLARYIGVFGTPENEGKQSIAMTAPVVMEKESKVKPETISMTAPVVMENSGDGDGMKKMMFMLPEEYNELSKIPKPTNSNVHIEHIPSEIGVVHRYNGNFNEKINREKARQLCAQLIVDGVKDITEDFVLDNYAFWGYNPPFTIPYFKRNEVWLKLNNGQATYLQEKFHTKNEIVSGPVAGTKGKALLGVGACGFLIGAFAFAIVMKSRGPRYSRLDG